MLGRRIGTMRSKTLNRCVWLFFCDPLGRLLDSNVLTRWSAFSVRYIESEMG
jgi:hypothetical protein